MKKWLLLLCGSLIGCSLYKKNDPIPTFLAQDFYNFEAISNPVYSPDYNKIAYISNKNGFLNIWIYDINTKQSSLLFSSNETVKSIIWNKYNNNIYYLQDIGGNELYGLYEYDAIKKKSIKIAGVTDTTIESFWLSEDATKIFYNENSRDKRYFDLYELDLKSKKPKSLWQGDDDHSIAMYHEKTKQVISTNLLGDQRNNVYVSNLNTNITNLLIDDQEHEYLPQFISKDGKYLYVLSNLENDFEEAYKIDLQTGKIDKIISKSGCDIISLRKSFNEKYYYYYTNENGNFVARFYKDEFKNEIKLPNLGVGAYSIEIDRDERHTIIKFANEIGIDVYIWDIKNAKIEKILSNQHQKIKREYLSKAVPLSYKARDGLTIHGFLYLPKQPKPKNGYPLLMNIHGGPRYQSTPQMSFNPTAQFLLNNGYALFFPNVRGSTGYGTKFRKMDKLDFGGGHLNDIIDGKEYLQTIKNIDPNRIAIMGGSFGGYSVLAALTKFPSKFKLGIDIVGVSDWIYTLSSFPAYWPTKQIEDIFGNINTDVAYLKRESPINYVDQIVDPLLIFHGKNDPRVKIENAEKIYHSIKERKGVAEMYVYDDEGHGFYKKHNLIDYNNKIISFLKKYL